MPTSATGNSRPGADARGFTLVELMIVLVIVGLASATALLAIPDGSGRVGDDAEAFAARLVAARDLAIVGGRDVRVGIDAGGYGFAARAGDTWVPAGARALRPQRWSAGVAALASGAVVFDTTGLATPADITLARGDTRAHVAVDAAGAVHVAAR